MRAKAKIAWGKSIRNQLTQNKKMKNSQTILSILLIILSGFIFSCSNSSKQESKSVKDELISSEQDSLDSIKEQVDSSDASKDFTYDIIDGWLKIGLDQKVISDRIGEPAKKGDDMYWEAIGTYVQEWKYPSKGITLEMESDSQNGVKHVLMITLESPSTGKTSNLISIGSSKDEVVKSYSDKMSDEFSSDKQIVVGSLYGGVIFTFENSIVTTIFIGAAAE
jgi:hypothetical protein